MGKKVENLKRRTSVLVDNLEESARFYGQKVKEYRAIEDPSDEETSLLIQYATMERDHWNIARMVKVATDDA